MGGRIFDGCASLTSVTLPAGITCISPSTFEGCVSLTSVTLPAELNLIQKLAFEGCTGLTDVHYPAPQAQWKAVEIEEGNDCLLSVTVHCSDGEIFIKN